MPSKTALVLLAAWLLCFATTYWLVDGSLWLSLVLASVISECVRLSMHLQEQRAMFKLADAELVRVSALVERLAEDLFSVSSKLERTEERLSYIEQARDA